MKTTFANLNELPNQSSIDRSKRSTLAVALGAGLLAALTGCYVDQPEQRRAHYPDQPPPRAEYAPPPPREGNPSPPPRAEYAPPPVGVASEAGLQDEYVYYPGYEIYYNSHRRQYTYREGDSWVSRPAPPRVAVDVLFASPSVRLDFHDAPAGHHQVIVRQYPKNWAPPGQPHARNQGRGERD